MDRARQAEGDAHVSRVALLRLAPLTNSLALINSDARRRELFDKVTPAIKGVPLVVDHEHQIGELLKLLELDDVDPVPTTRWLCASVRVDEEPSWLKRGTGASMGYRVLQRGELFGWPVIRHAYLDEVTVCSPSYRPVEPLARVVYVEDEAPQKVQTRQLATPALVAPARACAAGGD
jgi:hypothetical protein